jgi:hypothetical protein
MANLPLADFIAVYREELIRRCKEKAATREDPPPPARADIGHGVPLFLDQLVKELRDGLSKTRAISTGAGEHGHDLLLRGFTVSEVVHGYGDVCQSITDLAVEMDAPIDAEDFRTLNRCLDDAIAAAVTSYATEQQLSRDGESQELRHLTQTALTAFEVLLLGKVGVGGSTGAVLHRSLKALSAILTSTVAGEPSQRGTTR